MTKKNVNSKGFTVIELLAVIVIMGLLLTLAVPSITRYINESRRKNLITSIEEYIASAKMEVNGRKFSFRTENVIFALPIECVPLDRFGENPYGKWHQANKNYWAYVLVQYDKDNKEFIYGFTFKDSSGNAMYPVALDNIEKDGSQVSNKIYTDIGQPETGTTYDLIASREIWEKSGFIIEDDTTIRVLAGVKKGDGIETCTVYHGDAEGIFDIEDDEDDESENDFLMSAFFEDSENSNFLRTTIKRKEISAIYTVDNITVPENAIGSWDVSASGNGSIIAWAIKDEDNDELYKLYIGENGGVHLNPNSEFLFAYCSEVKIIDLQNLNFEETVNLTSMKGMFGNCYKLITIEGLENLNTQNVSEMTTLFYDCQNLLYIGDGTEGVFELRWDVSNVTSFRSMFFRNLSLTKIDLNNLQGETNNLTNVAYMFMAGHDDKDVQYYMNLKEIVGLNKLNVENVTNFEAMFWNCVSLETINLDGWNTSSAKNFSYMFASNGIPMILKKVEGLENFNTSKVSEMSVMFQNARELTVDLSKWDFKKVRYMDNFLYYTLAMETTINFNFDDVDNISYTYAFVRAKDIVLNYTQENEEFVDKVITGSTGFRKGCLLTEDENGNIVRDTDGNAICYHET